VAVWQKSVAEGLKVCGSAWQSMGESGAVRGKSVRQCAAVWACSCVFVCVCVCVCVCGCVCGVMVWELCQSETGCVAVCGRRCSRV
jgi:hypothetical protein